MHYEARFSIDPGDLDDQARSALGRAFGEIYSTELDSAVKRGWVAATGNPFNIVDSSPDLSRMPPDDDEIKKLEAQQGKPVFLIGIPWAFGA